jgi:outer membrane biosynthesis protein TonB
MNRIITILVTIFILLLLYIWISHVWGSDKPRHPRQIVDARETGISNGMMADADTAYTSPAETASDPYDGHDEYATEKKTEVIDEEITEPVKSEPVVEKKAEETKPANTKTVSQPKPEETKPITNSKPVSTPAKKESKPVPSSTPAAGEHLVIAGNFTQLVNAQQRMQDLKKAGFPEAEVVNFDLSEYHTVCAGRFSDVNEARRLVKKLKDYHKIDAYVRIGS